MPPDPEDPLGDKYVYALNSERGTGNRGGLWNLLRQGRRRGGVQGAAEFEQRELQRRTVSEEYPDQVSGCITLIYNFNGGVLLVIGLELIEGAVGSTTREFFKKA